MTTTSQTHTGSRLFQTRRGRVVLENLTAYLFLLPAGIIIFLFGLFPVAFAFFVSLHRWRRFPDEYIGFDQYTRALDGFAYIFFFWLGLAALTYAGLTLVRLWRDIREQPRSLMLLVPGVVNAAAVVLFARWFFTLLPIILDIPQRVRGQERVPGLFINEFFASFQFPQVVEAANVMLLAVAAAIVLSVIFLRLVKTETAVPSLLKASIVFLMLATGALTLQLTFTEMQKAMLEAQAAGETLALWAQIIPISAGAGLLVLAYFLWQRAQKQDSDRRFALMALAAGMLMTAGYLLVAEVPRALANADDDMLQGFGVTIMFVLGTVPFQLALGLGLAYLLFQNIKGKAFFRMVYFLPYVTPFVATSIVFKLLFSHRPTSPANLMMTSLGLPVQNWLLEPRGIFEILFGDGVPDVLAGPSLALIVIMLYTVWTYIGYDTVIFLTGLVNIPGELYEAARIDGGSGWRIFRHITLPLLSPTTFFLSLIAIIGTFQAFTQIWIMRSSGSSRSVDTVSVYIFETVRTNDPNMGYGSAMAFVLFVVILLLTLVQNRIGERMVFYG
jgi:ABC-type sugar transport system permease subunit